MRSAESMRAAAAAWDIAVPSRPSRLPGVSMAGFSGRTGELVDLRVVPYPAVTPFIDPGDGLLVGDASGARQRGSRRQESGRTVDPEITFVWPRMARTRGQARVERLADEVGWSRKRLWARFRSQLGLTSRRAAQLVRFDHAAHRLAAWLAVDDVAWAAEQPHG